MTSVPRAFAGAEHHGLSLADQLVGQFPDGCGLSDAVHAYHQDHGRLSPELQFGVSDIQKPGENLDQAFSGLLTLAVAIFPGFSAHEIVNPLRGGNARIGKNQRLLEVLIEFLAVRGIALKQLFQINVLPGFAKPAEQFVK